MLTEAEALERLARARHAQLATVRPDGRPHLVPITFALSARRLVTAVDQKPKRSARLQRLSNIRANPSVSVLADHYDDDWAQLWWVRADGSGRVVVSGDERGEAIAALVRRYPAYEQAPPLGPVILVDIERLVGWSARTRRR